MIHGHLDQYDDTAIDDREPLYECLPAAYPIPGDGACYEHFLTPRKVARCGVPSVVVTVGFEMKEAS